MDIGDDALTPAEPAVVPAAAEVAVAPAEPAEPAALAAPAVAAAESATRVAEPTVAELVADRLAGTGARFAFTVPGESFLPLLDSLPAAGVRVVSTRHEGGAAFMAAAAAHLTGKPQIVMATRTVGAANAAIGIHTARQDSAQLVALIGGVRREFRGREAFQESDLASGIGSLAAWSVELERPADAGRVMGEGIRHLTTGRPGPILIALPEDLLDMPAGGHASAAPASTGGTSPDRAAVRQILKWLAASRRGAIVAGGGVLRARASKRLMTLADALAVPVIAAWRRPDVVPNDYPGYLGMTGYWSPAVVRQRLEEADVLLVLGARLSEPASYGYRIPHQVPAGRMSTWSRAWHAQGCLRRHSRSHRTWPGSWTSPGRTSGVRCWTPRIGPSAPTPWWRTAPHGWPLPKSKEGSGRGRASTPGASWPPSSGCCHPTP